MKRAGFLACYALTMICLTSCKALTSGDDAPAVKVDRPQLVGAKGVETGDVKTAVDATTTGVDLSGLVTSVDNLTVRVGKVEADVVEVRRTTAAIALSTEATVEGVHALAASQNVGAFSGSGVYACVALALVLTAQLVGVYLWWTVRRQVKANGVKSTSPPAADVVDRAGAHPHDHPTAVTSP